MLLRCETGELIDRLLLAPAPASEESARLCGDEFMDEGEMVEADEAGASVDGISGVVREASPPKEQKVRKDGFLKQTRGKAHRRRYTAQKMLTELNRHALAKSFGCNVMNDDGTAAGTTVSYSSVCKWKVKKEELEHQAAMEKNEKFRVLKKMLKKKSLCKNMMRLTAKLKTHLKSLRAKGRKVTTLHALSIAKILHRRLKIKYPTGWPRHPRHGAFKPSKRWLYGWLHRNGFEKRCATNKRQHDHQGNSDAMDSHLLRLRCQVQKKPPHAPAELAIDPEYGFYKPHQRFNVDQTGVELDMTAKLGTWADEGERKQGFIRIQSAGPGTEKRFATLQLCFSGDLDGEQCNLAVFLRGKGKVKEEEKAMYPSGLDVYWQRNAWLDEVVDTEWIDRTWETFKAEKYPDTDLLLIGDNVKCQTKKARRDRLRAMRTESLRGQPNKTHVWQFIDRGPAHSIKDLMRQLLDQKLTSKKAFEKWLHMTASEKRIEFLWIAQSAFELYKENCVERHNKQATKCGHNIKINGEGHSLIRVESGPYVVKAYDPFPGLEEEMEADWAADPAAPAVVEDAEPAVSDDAESINSDSDSSSDVSEGAEQEIEDVAAAPPVAAAPSSPGGSSSTTSSSVEAADAAVPPAAESEVAVALSVEDVRELLTRAQTVGKLVEAAQHLVNKISACLSSPKKFRGKLITRDVLRHSFDAMPHLDQSLLNDWEL